MNADIARSWIVANLIASAVSAAFALSEYFVRSALDIGGAAATLAATAVYILVTTVFTALPFALYARLTGVVLASVVSAFPQRPWSMLHLAMGTVLGICLAFAMLVPDSSEPLDLESAAEAVFVFSVFAVSGGLLGVAVGGMQALVLCRAARGVKLWVATSGIAMAILAVAVLAIALLAPDGSVLIREMMLSGTILVASMIGAGVMIPAVLKLHSKAG